MGPATKILRRIGSNTAVIRATDAEVGMIVQFAYHNGMSVSPLSGNRIITNIFDGPDGYRALTLGGLIVTLAPEGEVWIEESEA